MKFNIFILPILLLCVSFFSCQEKTVRINCEIVEEIIERDQRYRGKYHDLVVDQFTALDSLIKDQGIEEGFEGRDKLDGGVFSDLIAKSKMVNLDKYGMKPHQLDSIWDLQDQIDRENVIRVINIIENVNDSIWTTMPFKCARKSFFTFVHCPDDLMKDVKEAIDKINLKEKDKYQYRHIMWHLTGRKSPPGAEFE